MSDLPAENIIPTPAQTAPIIRAIAAGIVRTKNLPPSARVTLTVQPSGETSIDAIRNWPNATAALFGPDGRIEIAVAPYPDASPADHATLVDAKCEWSAPNANVARKINDFWQRLMVSRWSGSVQMKPDWADFIEVLKCAHEDGAELPDVILATPHAEASLAFTLERGRTILDALQGEERAVRSGPSTALASFDEASYDEAVRYATTSSDGELLWPTPQTVADITLSGRRGLDGLIRRVHKAHHRATPGPERKWVCRDEKQMLDIARARYGALLTHPVLQRLVGFAADVTVAADRLAAIASASSGYVQISLGQDPRIWTLAKYEAERGGWFSPASKKEADAELTARAAGRAMDTQDLPERLGVINLGGKGANGPRYDLCTVDPALATENDLRHRQEAESVEKMERKEAEDARKEAKNFDLPPSRPEVSSTSSRTGAASSNDLRTGGLRLLDRNRLLAVCQQLGRAADEKRAARVCLSGQSTVLQDAYDLETGVRLLVGVRPASGDVEWRCPQFRQVQYRDPEAGEHNDWVERELIRRLGPASGARRIELDAATLNAIDQIVQTDADGAPTDDTETKIAALVTESTVAAWGGEPMGLPPTQASGSRSNKETRVSFASIDGLNVIRSYAPTAKARGNERHALNPRLRFGWPYHVALIRVVQGGVALTREEAAARLSASTSYALPPTSVANTASEGRRFTRHERVDAPMVLFLDEHLRELKGIKPTQHGTSLVVRSSRLAASARPKRTHRILAPPPVPLHFASLHGVFDHLGENVKRPPEGLQGFTRPDVKRKDNDPLKPQHVRPSATRPEAVDPELRYYPDPAACYLALALKRPESSPDEAWLHEPLILHVATEPWPASTPVRLECVAADEQEENSLQLRHIGRISHAGATLHSVQCLLRPGEDVELHAWYIPTIGQLANWFDAVQAAALLATHEGRPSHVLDTQSACFRGLRALVGAAAGTPPPGLANSEVCTGAGSLPLPPRATVRMLAALVHQTMLKRAVPALAATLPMRLTHAVDYARTPSFLPGTVAAARRKFPGGDADGGPGKESRLDFITANSAQEWDARSSQEGAVGALLRGRLKLDPVGTGSFEIEIECAGPNTDTLDDPKRGRGIIKITEDTWPEGLQEGNATLFGFAVGRDHKVKLTKTLSKALRVDGLPYPQDCRAALREDWTLEQLQAAAWGQGKPLGNALRCALSNFLTSSGARHVKLRAVAIPRHYGLMPKAPDASAENAARGPFVEFWLPSTAAPSPPVVDRIQSGFIDRPSVRIGNLASDGTVTLRAERRSSHRIWLRRPWFSSGEDERLGIVLWPPGLFSKGTLHDDIQSEIPKLEVLDGDLGIGGQFVSRWGADPIMRGRAPDGPLLLPTTFEGDCEDVQTAFMPIPAQGPWSSQEGLQGGVEKQTPKQYFAVALKTFVPKFDPAEELWYVDVALNSASNPSPRMRLGLVRYQPHAREDVQTNDGTAPVRLRVSTPVAEWIQPLPRRMVEVTCRTSSRGKLNITTVIITVSGAFPQPDQEADASAILVDPSVPTDKTRPALEIELLRHRKTSGTEPSQEELARGTDRMPCVWRTWIPGGPGRAARKGAEWAWTCSFEVEGNLGSHGEWRHAVAVREIILGKRANEESTSIGGKDKPLGTGPRYFARVELA